MYFPKQQQWINPEPLNPEPVNAYKLFNTLYIIQLQQKNAALVPFSGCSLLVCNLVSDNGAPQLWRSERVLRFFLSDGVRFPFFKKKGGGRGHKR